MLFNGLIPINEQAQDGKQTKAIGTGIYKSVRTNNLYYVKRSDSFPGDDIAEYISSQILLSLVDESAAQCALIRNNSSNEIFLASLIAPGRNHEALQKQGKVAGCWDKESRENVYKKLQKNSVQTEFARTLAASMLIGDYDVHPGNFILYKDMNNTSKIYKMDHGWGLHNICSSDASSIMGIRPAFGLYGIWFRFMPTNHFGNYPELIYSGNFLFAIDHVLEHYNQDYITSSIDGSLRKIEALYPKNYKKQLELFSLIAAHIGDLDFSSLLPANASLEEQCRIAKIRLSTVIITSLENRKNKLLNLRKEISRSIVDKSIKQRKSQAEVNVPFFSSIRAATIKFNDLKNCGLMPIQKQLELMGESLTPKNFVRFFLRYNYLLDQDKVSLVLCTREHSKYLISLFGALPLDNQTPAFALALMLRSNVILIPTDPTRLNNMFTAFTKAYLKANPKSFLHKFHAQAQKDFFGQIFCVMASNRDKQTISFDNFYANLPPKLRNYADKEFYASIYQEAFSEQIDFSFATQTGFLFEREDFNRERKFNEFRDFLSTKKGLEHFSSRYSFLPPNCTVQIKVTSNWLQYILGSKWQMQIYSENEKLICTVTYYKPRAFFRLFGTKEKLQFLPSSEHRNSLDYTAQLARELDMQHQKVFGGDSFSIESIKQSLHTAHERTKFKKAISRQPQVSPRAAKSSRLNANKRQKPPT